MRGEPRVLGEYNGNVEEDGGLGGGAGGWGLGWGASNKHGKAVQAQALA